jgi:hypothetical protein
MLLDDMTIGPWLAQSFDTAPESGRAEAARGTLQRRQPRHLLTLSRFILLRHLLSSHFLLFHTEIQVVTCEDLAFKREELLPVLQILKFPPFRSNLAKCLFLR